MSANTQLSDSHKELDWWNGLNDTQKKEANTIWPRKSITSLTTSHIIGLYIFHFAETKKSNTSVKEGEEGEEGFTKGEWLVGDGGAFKEKIIDNHFTCFVFHTSGSIYQRDKLLDVYGYTKEEADANAHLIAAAKDLYFALSNLMNFFENYPPHFSDGNSMAVDLDGFKEQMEALKKANPKLL